MAFGWAGAAAGANDQLQALLLRAFQERQAEEQRALQQQRLAQEASQFESQMGLREREFTAGEKEREADRAYRTGQVERQATQDRAVENQRGVRRQIGDFLVQRGGTPIGPSERQTLTGMAVQEDVDLPKTLTDDPNREHQERMREIAAQGQNALKVAEVRGATEPVVRIQTVDAEGNPITRVLPRSQAAGQDFATGPTADMRNRAAARGTTRPVLDSISELSERINTQQGVYAKMAGGAAKAAAKANLDDDVAEYQALVAMFTPLLARAVGHVGVLTEQDVQSVRSGLPRPGDSKNVRDRKIARIEKIVGAISTPTGQAAPETSEGLVEEWTRDASGKLVRKGRP